MTVSSEGDLFIPTTLEFGARRQRAKGTIATNIITSPITSLTPSPDFTNVDKGVWMGQGDNVSQGMVREYLVPQLSFSSALLVGSALMQAVAANGNYIISEGTNHTGAGTTLSAALTTRCASNTITVADATGFNDGDWIQIGVIATPGTPVYSDLAEVHQVVGAPAGNTITLDADNLYKYPAGTTVGKVDKTQYVRHYAFHAKPGDYDRGADDYFSTYVHFSNATDNVKYYIYNAKCESFTPNLRSGQIASYTASFQAASTTRNNAALAATITSPDPSPFSISNVIGSFNVLGNAYDAFTQFGISANNAVIRDNRMTSQQANAIKGISTAFGFSFDGPFAKDYFDQIVWGGASGQEVSPSIPEGAITYLAQSQDKAGAGTSDGTKYAWAVHAPRVQFPNYGVNLSGATAPVDGSIKAMALPNLTTGIAEWYQTIINTCTSAPICSHG